MTGLHTDEVPIDLPLVWRLLTRQAPELAGLPLRPVYPSGTDNVLVRVGSDLVVRLPRKPAAEPGLLVEVEWLPRLAPVLPLAVPEPVIVGTPDAGYPFAWAVCRWLTGRQLGSGPLDSDGAAALGAFVAALHDVQASGGPRALAGQRGGPVAGYDATARRAIAAVAELQAAGRIEPGLFDRDRAETVWAAALDAPAWDGPGVWTHRDLHGGNLLTSARALTGVIDFGGLAVGDPATDVIGAFHVLRPEHRALFGSLVGVDDATWTRARGLALSQGLEALPYYLDTHPGMVTMARRVIAATLHDA